MGDDFERRDCLIKLLIVTGLFCVPGCQDTDFTFVTYDLYALLRCRSLLYAPQSLLCMLTIRRTQAGVSRSGPSSEGVNLPVSSLIVVRVLPIAGGRLWLSGCILLNSSDAWSFLYYLNTVCNVVVVGDMGCMLVQHVCLHIGCWMSTKQHQNLIGGTPKV